MSLRKISFFILIFVLVLSACEEDNGTFTQIPLLNRFDQQVIDDAAIVEYLENNYYNSSAFDMSSPDARIKDLVITALEEGESVPNGSTILIDAVETILLNFADTDYKYYVLKLKQGSGVNAPTFADDIRANYVGSRLDNTIFDDRINSPTFFNLTGTITGWGKVFPRFNVAENFSSEDDGVVNFSRPGIGVMFIPSGIAYFDPNFRNSGVPFRLPLIFKFELLQAFESDTDQDGIPSYLEDLDENETFSIFDSVDNTDGDARPNVDDNDDDNDGELTRDEITITTETRTTAEEVRMIPLEDNQVLLNEIKKNEDDTMFIGTIITFTDEDGDSIPDYLDAE